MARPAAREAELPFAPPVPRSLPASVLHQGPAFAHPEVGALVAPVGDEGGVLGIAHQPLADGKGLQPDPVAGGFVVEVKLPRGRIETDLHEASLEVLPAPWPRVGPAGLVVRFGFGDCFRFQGIAAEAIQQIHQQQLLVLLLVLQPQFHQGGR